MRAFLLSIVILLVVALGAGFVLNSQFETSAEKAYSTGNVRLQ